MAGKKLPAILVGTDYEDAKDQRYKKLKIWMIEKTQDNYLVSIK